MSNRDIAILILGAAFATYGLAQPPVRAAAREVLKAFLVPKILLPSVLFYLYLASCILVAHELGLWNRSLLSETALWLGLSAFPLMLSVTDRDRKRRFLRSHLRDILAWTGFLAFAINLATFGLWLEVILQFLLLTLLLLVTVAQGNPEHRTVEGCLSFLVGLLVLALLSRTVLHAWRTWGDTDWTQLGLSLGLSMWLPLVALLFIYAFLIVAEYEVAFMWFSWGKSPVPAGVRDKAALIWAVKTRWGLLRHFKPYWATRICTASSWREKCAEARVFAEDAAEKEARVAETTGVFT